MIGAVQLGLLAASIVLFVPMGMAGWHLSRNKVLFFSGALFITLAVGVHLTPYFPSMSLLISSLFYPHPISHHPISCIPHLHSIIFHNNSWDWADSGPVSACGFQKLDRSDASELLNGSWVVIAGDSQARLAVVSLLELILGETKEDLFKRHSDYQIMVDEIGMKLDFVWAPYITNLTDLMMIYKQKSTYPDLLIMGGGFWHMLHMTNASDYGVSLQLLRDSLVSVPFRSPHSFWLGMPSLVNGMLNTEEKREKMSDGVWDAYDKEVYRSRLLRQSGGPLLLLDMYALSKKCGVSCTEDGMHYNVLVYEAAVQIMLNALLIESHQKLDREFVRSQP